MTDKTDKPGHGVLLVEPQAAFTSPITDAIVAISAALNHGDYSLSKECRETLREAQDRLRSAVETVSVVPPAPMQLRCPKCGTDHIDEGEWATRPHKTHQCQNPACKHEWRPFPYATVGVSGVVPQGAEQSIRELAIKTRAARTAWFENYGVPVSHTFADFAEALGNLINACEGVKSCCKAQKSADPPQDCDWPFCGCDPAADKVIEAIQESGFSIVKDEDLLRLAHAAASQAENADRSDLKVAKIAYGKLFNENAALEGRCDELRDQRDQAREALRWIPVSVRLPEVGGTYLVRGKFADPFIYCTDFGHFFKLESGHEWMDSASKPLDVTHWMPLPAAPAAVPPSEDAPSNKRFEPSMLAKLSERERELTSSEDAPATPRRRMRLPYNSTYPNYREIHLEDEWCAKVGCVPACEPAAQPAGKEPQVKKGQI